MFVGHLAYLKARDTSFVLVPRAPIVMIEPSAPHRPEHSPVFIVRQRLQSRLQARPPGAQPSEPSPYRWSLAPSIPAILVIG